MNSDAAVKVKKEDLLNRYGFASEIVKGILSSFQNGQDSMVIGINGEWGCGKSSLMEFIKSEILINTQTDPYRNYIFEFNPWRIRGNDELLKEFLVELGKILGNYSESYENLKTDFNRLVDAADKINAINPNTTSKFAIKGIKTIKDLIKKPLSLEILKSESLERLADQNIKLFVFIDDLDRCTPKEITKLFQVVKLNLNYKNTVFFIAYDKEIVVSSLNREYGKNGEKYLEKIVQVDYLVPKILPERLKLLFRDNLSTFNNRFKLNIQLFDIDSIWESGLKKYISSLRHIYRLINALELRISHIIEDVYPFDFLILESIRIFEYSVYEWIYKHREDLIYREMALVPNINVAVKEDSSKNDYIQNHPELKNTSSETKSLLLILFEVDDSLDPGVFYLKKPRGRSSDIDINRRISSQKYFDHYFSFEVSSQNLPNKEIRNFIEAIPSKKKEILASNLSKNIFERFLEQLSGTIVTEPFQIKSDVFEILLDYSDEHQFEVKNVGDYKMNALALVLRIITKIGKSLINQEEQNLILDLILIKRDGSYSRFYLLDQLFLRVPDGKIYPETDFFSETLIKERYTEINVRLKSYVKFFGESTISDLSRYDIFLVKYFLTRYNDFYPKKYKAAMGKLLKVPDNLLLLFRSSLTQATRSGYDKPGYNLKDHQLREFSTDRFDKLISKINPVDLNDENKKYYNLFLKLKENRFNKDQFFTLDLENWSF